MISNKIRFDYKKVNLMNSKNYQILFLLVIILIGMVVKLEATTSEEEECNVLIQQAKENLTIQPQQALAFSLEAVQIKNLPDAAKANALAELSNVYVKIKKYDEAINAINEAEQIYSETKNYEKVAESIDSQAYINILRKTFTVADSLLTENLMYRDKHDLSLISTKQLRGSFYLKMDRPAEAITYFHAILALARDEYNQDDLAYLLQLMGETYRNLSELDSAYTFYLESYELYLAINDPVKIGRLLHSLGTIKKQMASYDEALDYYFASLKYSEKYDKPSRVASTLRNIGIIQKKIGDKDAALKYAKQSLEYSLESSIPANIAGALTGIGVIYNSIGDYEQALDYYQRAEPYIVQSGDKKILAAFYHNLAFYYKNTNKFTESEKLYLMGLEICREIGYRHGQVLILVNLGGLYMETWNTEKAEKSLQEALILSKKNGSKEKTKDIYEGLYNYYSKIGNYGKAYEFSRLYITIKDSIFNDQKTIAIASIQEKYETEKKENEINALEQVNGEQELKLAKNRLAFWRLLFVLATFAVILPFLIRRYLQNFKQAKELKEIVTTQEKSLQDTINDLRNTTLKKNQAEMRQIVFQENFDFLYKTAIEFLRLTSEDDIYSYLAESIHEMVGDSIVIVSSYHKESNIITSRAVCGMDEIEDRFTKILGQSPLGIKYEIPQYAKNVLEKGKLYFIKGGFHEYTFYTIPHHIADAVVRLAKIGDIYTIGFYFNDELWGNASIMLTNNNTLKNLSGIEAFVNQAAMAIQKRHVQIKLQDSEEKYRQLVEQINDGIIVVQGNEIKFFNKRFVQQLGFENVDLSSFDINKLLTDKEDKDLQDVISEIMSNDEEYMRIEANVKHTSGRDINVDIRSSCIIYDHYPAKLLVIRDVTDMKIAQKRLLYSERLSGLGELAAGVAHEIKNPLGNISSSAQIITSDYDVSEDTRLYLDIILRNVENANKTVKKLTDFATPGEINLRAANIIEVIDSTCHLLKGKLRENNIALEKDFQQIPDLIIDPVHIQGVMVNIVINAIQAQKLGGVLNISARKSNDEVEIIFKDDGCGISESDQERIFNPFFTTKEEGSGLGLSMAYKIMHHHHGKIDIISEVDKGTSVVLHFPLKF